MSDIEDTKKKSEIERAFNIVSNAAEKRGEELKKLEENAKTIENKLKIYEAKDKLNIKNIESRDKYGSENGRNSLINVYNSINYT